MSFPSLMPRFRAWRNRRKGKDDRQRCARGEHDWCCLNEADSLVTPVCEMRGMPVRCPRCQAIAVADWVPGKGLSNIEILSEPVPSAFFVIEKEPNGRQFWNQARTEWTGLLEADHFHTEGGARRLIEAQPYMHSFFRKAVIRRCTVGFDASHAAVSVLPPPPSTTSP